MPLAGAAVSGDNRGTHFANATATLQQDQGLAQRLGDAGQKLMQESLSPRMVQVWQHNEGAGTTAKLPWPLFSLLAGRLKCVQAGNKCCGQKACASEPFTLLTASAGILAASDAFVPLPSAVQRHVASRCVATGAEHPFAMGKEVPQQLRRQCSCCSLIRTASPLTAAADPVGDRRVGTHMQFVQAIATVAFHTFFLASRPSKLVCICGVMRLHMLTPA
jgi:hypothetical protein